MRNSTIASIILFFTLISNQNYGQSQLIDRVIAKVGSEYILLSEIEDNYAYTKQQQPSITEDMKCQILENVLAQKLIVYQARLDSVIVNDEEVETQLNFRFDGILRQMNGDEEFFKDYYGASVEEMKNRYRDDQKQQILADRMQQNLINSVEITPKEVKEFYQNIPVDSIPYLDSEVELGELVMKPIISDAEKNVAKDQLIKIADDINTGEITFEEAAQKYSMDPGSGSRGGDLGFAKRGTYVPEFEATVYNLEKGETSDVIETQFGFHIIKMVERRGNNIRAKHILIKPEITDAAKERTSNKLDSIKTLVELDSMSFEKAVRKFGYDKAQSYSNNGRMKNPLSGNNFFETDDLDPDIYFEIIDIKPGNLTSPLEYKSRQGEAQFRLIQLQTITKPHKANLEQDYDKIAKFAKEGKKAEYFNEWITDKLKSTYIDVDEMYIGCPNIQELLN